MNPAESAQAPVLFEERAAHAGRCIGIATLNTPKTLNSLSLEMIRLLDAQLRRWADAPHIVCVVLRGAGDKAFCAGGDLQELYRSMRRSPSAHGDIGANTYASAFFAEQYRLDDRIHHYVKPLLCWGHGIVMGGGVGLMSGASHRVVTEHSRLAMPEVGIGLFPDVGCSWRLRRIPRGAGLFLALTGASLNGSDAVYAGLADVQLRHGQYQSVLAALCAHAWSGEATHDRAHLGMFLQGLAQPDEPGPLQRHAEWIARLVSDEQLCMVAAAIMALRGEDCWLQKACASLAAAAPGSVRLAWELQRDPRIVTLADALRIEYVVALHAAAHGDFAEGIRALLIDKDHQPRWRPATLAEADAAWAQTFFRVPWEPAQHPLADLGGIAADAAQR